MLGSRMEDVGERRLRQGRTRESAEGFYSRRVFREEEVVESFVLKELELMAKKLVEREAVREKAMSYDAAQRERIAQLERKVEFFEVEPALPKTAVKRNKVGKKRKRGSSSKNSCLASSPEMKRLKLNTG